MTSHSAANPTTPDIAEFISGQHDTDISPHVIARIRLLILDRFSCVLPGTACPKASCR